MCTVEDVSDDLFVYGTRRLTERTDLHEGRDYLYRSTDEYVKKESLKTTFDADYRENRKDTEDTGIKATANLNVYGNAKASARNTEKIVDRSGINDGHLSSFENSDDESKFNTVNGMFIPAENSGYNAEKLIGVNSEEYGNVNEVKDISVETTVWDGAMGGFDRSDENDEYSSVNGAVDVNVRHKKESNLYSSKLFGVKSARDEGVGDTY